MTPEPAPRVTLPDGTSTEVAPGTLIGEFLASRGGAPLDRHFAALLDGRAVDLRTPIERSCTITPLDFANPLGREILQHSAAHLVAKAVVETIPVALPTAGPPTEEGFYYDFDVRPITQEDLASIEEAMDRSVRAREPFERIEVDQAEARRMVASNPHKLAYIAEIPEGSPVSFYRTGAFVDLCRGPHVPDTGWLEGVRVLGFSAVSFGEGPSAASRQRIRGVGFPTKADLEAFLRLRAEAEARDHRALGQRLGLFLFVEEAPGFPFWLPNGMIVVRELERFVTEHFVQDGYHEVRTPLMFDQSIFETSGHWEHFQQNLFLSQVDERTYVLKPMNCPGSMLIFRSTARSYRELPLRLAEFAPLHRREASGTLHGLTRVREMVQDDAHIFVSEDLIEGELRSLLAWIARAFTVFRLAWTYELSTRPASFLGDPEQWDRAEATLEKVLKESGIAYKVSPGEGAFYGPKIDIHIRDSLGRPWQTGTIQLDYQIPRRFRLEYQGADGHLHTPIVIHRTILGTWERFLGVLLEHCGGKLPPWLAPVQVRVLPVTDRQAGAAEVFVEELRSAGLRAESSGSSDTLSKRVREAELDRIPYIAVLGEKETLGGTVALRTRGVKGQTSVTRAAAREAISEKVRSRSFDP